MNSKLAAPCPVWLALDMEDFEFALEFVKMTKEFVHGYKVHSLVEDALCEKAVCLRAAGANHLWWDRKVKDTRETAAKIATIAQSSGFQRMSVHASGGIDMMMATKHATPALEIVAVTVLTSLEDEDIESQTGGMSVRSAVLSLARNAALAGVDGVVISGQEVSLLARHAELQDLKVVVPGTNTFRETLSGQKRSIDAPTAIVNGAGELVLGREIWADERPTDALHEIYQAIRYMRNI